MKSKELSLYIHIPFCVRKCAYCDFLSFAADESLRESYLDRLRRELEKASALYSDRRIISVFMGGGTPSVLKGEQITALMQSVADNYALSDEAEISLEANPGTVDAEKLRAIKRSGINRLSIGCQSLDDKELELLGRIHREEDFYRAFESAREAGFDNINVDMMSALPGQTVTGYINGVERLIKLSPEHVSAYSLIIEEGTPFYDRYHDDVLLRDKGGIPRLLPGEEDEREMLYEGRKLLNEAGYLQYEISNYSKKGHECRHNLVYWTRGDYAGFGLGAASCVDEVRWKNTEDIKEYLRADASGIIKDRQVLSEEDQRSEAMFLGLRLIRGVDTEAFKLRYGVYPRDIYGEWIEKMSDEGLLYLQDDRLLLTEKGQDVANYVMVGFV